MSVLRNLEAKIAGLVAGGIAAAVLALAVPRLMPRDIVDS